MYNFNGPSEFSNAATFKACTSPSNISPPYTTTTTETTIQLAWTAPSNLGGCPITGYELYVDDGNGGNLVKTDASDIDNKPYLRSHILTFAPLLTGEYFRVRILAKNEIGSVSSSLTSILLADVPSKPLLPPEVDLTATDTTQIRVTYAAPASTGGSDILSYEV